MTNPSELLAFFQARKTENALLAGVFQGIEIDAFVGAGGHADHPDSRQTPREVWCAEIR